jgi:uncharacterized protein YecT (DUF1311 family)
MKLSASLALGAFVILNATLAHALDCTKAIGPIDRLLCATQELRKAEEAMSAAYFKLLRSTANRDFREALIRSQRRWLKERSSAPGFDAFKDDPADGRKALLKMTRDRQQFLRAAVPIRAMEEQNEAASKVSGGLFAGYDTFCYFLPPPHSDWRYACFGTKHRQHHDRICSLRTEWASGHVTEYRLVSVLRNGEPKPVASCSIGYAETREHCPESSDDPETKAIAHWNTNPQPANNFSVRKEGGFWKYDPDIPLSKDEQPWMDDCLLASTYPPADLSRPDSAPK